MNIILRQLSGLACSLWLFLSPAQSSASPLQDEVLKTAEKYLYVVEAKGDNRGPEIDKWLDNLGIPRGNPYCAAFVVWCYTEAAKNLGIKQPLPKIGRVSALYSSAKKNPYKFKVIPADRVFRKIETLEPADLPCWAHGNPKGNFNGHIGVLLLQKDHNTFNTIEGNTGPGAAGSQRDGDGVYKRTRTLGRGQIFQVVGFIRVR